MFYEHPYATPHGFYTHDGRVIWEIEPDDPDREPLRELCVIASTGEHERQQMADAKQEDPDSFLFIKGRGIRIRDMYCGEWEMSERDAINLTGGQARRVACALLAAAEEYERFLSRASVTP